MAFCSKCGANLPDGARFCNVCGAPQNPAPAQTYQQPYQQPQPYQQAPQYQQPQYFQQAPPVQPYQPAPQAQRPPRKKKRGGFIRLLLFLLLLGGGYYGYQWMKDQGLFDMGKEPLPRENVFPDDTDYPGETDYYDNAEDAGDYSSIRDFLLGGGDD